MESARVCFSGSGNGGEMCTCKGPPPDIPYKPSFLQDRCEPTTTATVATGTTTTGTTATGTTDFESTTVYTDTSLGSSSDTSSTATYSTALIAGVTCSCVVVVVIIVVVVLWMWKTKKFCFAVVSFAPGAAKGGGAGDGGHDGENGVKLTKVGPGAVLIEPLPHSTTESEGPTSNKASVTTPLGGPAFITPVEQTSDSPPSETSPKEKKTSKSPKRSNKVSPVPPLPEIRGSLTPIPPAQSGT